MDKITEEILTNLIKRVEALEQQISTNKSLISNQPQTQPGETPGIPLASEGQRKYILGLGGEPWNGMTKQEASRLIETLLKRKKQIEETQTIPPKIYPLQAPEENYGDLNSESKPLTEEEIEEIGEESLL